MISRCLDDSKAVDIEIIDLPDEIALADSIFIANGSSSRQVKSIAEKLKDTLSAHRYKGVKTEGLAQGDWVVVDAGDIIVHLFRPEVRDFYNIEKMWLADGDRKPSKH